MSEAVKEGKVRYLKLSNVTADEVRRSHTASKSINFRVLEVLWRDSDLRLDKPVVAVN